MALLEVLCAAMTKFRPVQEMDCDASASDSAVPHFSIEELSKLTGMKKDDVIHSLHAIDCLGYYKNQHVLILSESSFHQLEAYKAKRRARIDPSALNWHPKDWSARGRAQRLKAGPT